MPEGPTTEPNVEEINDFHNTSGPIKVLSNLVRDTKGIIGKPDTFFAKLGGLPTKICFDTGAGTNVVDKAWSKEAQIDIVERVKFSEKIEIQVANGEIVSTDEGIVLSMTHANKKAEITFLEIDNLPFPAILGSKTHGDLDIWKRHGVIKWQDKTLPRTENEYIHNVGHIPYFQRTETPPVQVYCAATRKAKPREMVPIEVKVEGKLPAKTAFFWPSNEDGKLIETIPHGLVNLRQNGTTLLLYANQTNRARTIKEGTPLGNMYFLTNDDIRRTHIISMGKQLTRSTNATKFMKRVTRQTEKWQTLNKQPKKTVRVSVNYINKVKNGDIKAKIIQGKKVKPIYAKEFFKDIAKEIDKTKPEQMSFHSVDTIIAQLGIVEEKETESLHERPTEKEDQEIYDLFELHKSRVNNEQLKQLLQHLKDNKDVWKPEADNKIGHTDSVEHEIKTKEGTKPIKQRPRRTNEVEELIAHDAIRLMFERGVIQKSQSPWASPILLADKKNGKVRFCVDYRKLNDNTIKDSYPLPKMDDIIAALGKATYMSSIDLTDAFWSIKVKEEDREKTAFTTKGGLWEFISMPFGLTNAPATQQRFIEDVLQGLIWRCCFAYIDDILCFSPSFDQHMEDLDKIFKRLKEHNLKVQPPKCSFLRPNFEILGFVATPEGLKPSEKKKQALLDYQLPKSKKEVQTFLGMASWVRRFIPNFTQYSIYLRETSKKEGEFKMTKEAEKEFHKLKELMTEHPCLAYPQMNKQFYIHVDASILGMGAILTQLDKNGKHQVVEYASKSFGPNPPSINHKREAEGIVWALDHFHYYVKGRHPIVYCDCQCLRDIYNYKGDKEKNVMRMWVARLLEYQVRLMHKPGKMMVIPDTLSRMKHLVDYSEEEKDNRKENIVKDMIEKAIEYERRRDKRTADANDKILDKLIPLAEEEEYGGYRKMRVAVNAVQTRSKTKQSEGNTKKKPQTKKTRAKSKATKEKEQKEKKQNEDEIEITLATDDLLAKEQRKDEHTNEMIEYLQLGKVPTDKRKRRALRERANKYVVDENGILRKWGGINMKYETPPAVLPKGLWKPTLEMLHDNLNTGGGHRKYAKLMDILRRYYYFDGMAAYVKRHCDLCEDCQVNTKSKKMKAPLHPYHSEYPGLTVHIDCTGGGCKTKRGNKHILAIVEAFSNHIRLYPLEEVDGESVARALLSYISVHSMPLRIITDNGPEFANSVVSELKALLGFEHSKIAPHNSKANGKVEVAHKSVKNILRNYINNFKEDWDIHLPMVEFAINVQKNDTTGYSPFLVMFGRHPIMPLDAFIGPAERPAMKTSEYIKELEEKREAVINFIKEQREKKAKARVRSYNKANAHSMKKLKIGDTVRIENTDRVGDHPSKYNSYYSYDIYVVVGEEGPGGNYLLQNVRRPTDRLNRNIEHLKKVASRFDITISDGGIISVEEDGMATIRLDKDNNGNDKEEMWDEDATGNLGVVMRDSSGCEEGESADPNSTPDSHYQVEKIVGKRTKSGDVQYCIKWKGFNASYNQWKSIKDLNCNGLIDDYEMEQKQPLTNKKKSRYRR